MGTKVVTTDVTSLDNTSTANTLNLNIQKIADEFDKVLYRDGTQDAQGNMNMNSKRIMNLPAPGSMTDPARLQDIADLTNIGVINVPADYTATGSGAVTRAMTDKLIDFGISVKDFGALGDGITDDTTAIQLAANVCSNSVLLFPPGTYKITAPISFSGRSNVLVTGYGAIVKCGASRITSYFDLGGSTRVTVVGFTFDQLVWAMPAYTALDYGNLYNVPIYSNASAEDVAVYRCKFVNLYTSGVYYHGSTGLTVELCEFTSPVQTQNQWMQHIHLQTVAGKVKIINNSFDNAAFTNPNFGPCGVYCSSITGSIIINDNTFNYCGRNNSGSHRLGVIDFYGDAVNARVENNIAKNCMAQFMRFSSVRNGLIKNNRIEVNSNAEASYSTLTIESTIVFFGGAGQVGCQDITVEDNLFEDLSGRAGFTLGVISYDWGAPATNIKLLNNSFVGCFVPLYMAGPFYDVRIEGNEARGGRGQLKVEGKPTPGVTAIAGTEVNSMYDRLFIRKNVLYNEEATSVAEAISMATPAIATTAKVGQFWIEGNTFKGASSVGAPAISTLLFSSDKTNTSLIIKDNVIDKYTYALFPRDGGETLFESNKATNLTSGVINDDGSNLYAIKKRNNRLATGKLIGTATLVAGTVTVNNDQIRTGDIVILSHQVTGGTPGILTLGTITSGTSFAINSTNAADTSTVAYEIIH